MEGWRGKNTPHTLLHEFKLRLTAASGGLHLARDRQDSAIDNLCYFQGACLQLRISIELLFFATLASRSSREARELGQQWSDDHSPAKIRNKLEKLGANYWPEAISTQISRPGMFRAEKTKEHISSADTVGLYGQINNLLHAKRQHVTAGIAADYSWVQEGLHRLRDQTTHFILYTENNAKYVVTMRWGEDCPPHIATLKTKSS